MKHITPMTKPEARDRSRLHAHRADGHLAIGGILMAMAVPAFNNFVLNDRDIGQINSLVSSFNYARSEAIKLNSGGVQVCTSATALNCNGGTAWNRRLDRHRNTPRRSGSDGAAIRSRFRRRQYRESRRPPQTEVTFSSTGMVDAGDHRSRSATAAAATYSRDVEVNATGRVASSHTPGQSAASAALTCP